MSSVTKEPTVTSTSWSIEGLALKLDRAEDFAPYLKSIPDECEEIVLRGNTLGVGACEALGARLKELKKLKVVDAADIFTGRLISEIPSALSSICDSLISTTTLTTLDLSDNAFGGRCAEPMVPFLSQNLSLQVFKLNNNGLGIAGGEIVSGALLASAEASEKAGKESQLKVVVCGRNRLENGSAPFWSKAFAAHKNLQEVRMFQNGIRMEGIIQLSTSLTNCTNLEILDFQDNTVTLTGSRAIAKSLSSWPNLKTLNLSDCLIGSKGGILIGTQLSLGTNPQLEVLKLQYGEFDHRTLTLLSKAIKEYGANLVTLEINGNKADEEDECIQKIKEALESHGHEDALDELDDMEEPGSDEEDDEEADEEEEENKEAEIEEAADEEPSEKKAAGIVETVADGLADLMSKVNIGSKSTHTEE